MMFRNDGVERSQLHFYRLKHQTQGGYREADEWMVGSKDEPIISPETSAKHDGRTCHPEPVTKVCGRFLMRLMKATMDS